MTIGIIGAMDEEVEILLDNMSNIQQQTIANCVFYSGYLKDKKVVLLKSGIGKVNAAMATTIMFERYSPSYVINTGSAGGYSENLNVGDIVISTEVVHHDVDVTAFDYMYGQIPGMPATYRADVKLTESALRAVKKLKVRAVKGIIATGDAFMNDPKRVSFVLKQFNNVIALEMEAASIAQVCYQYDKPFVVIRALSDIAGKDSPISFDEFLSRAVQNSSQLILNMIDGLVD